MDSGRKLQAEVNRALRRPPVAGPYECLCRMTELRGLHVELRLDAHGLSDIRLSNALSEDLNGIEDIDRASRVLQGYLRTERYV